MQQFFGIRSINDAVYRREDRATRDPSTQALLGPDGRFDTAWGTGPGQTVDTHVYQLADPQGSVVAAVFDGSVNPRLVDEVEYDPYGQARRTAQGDFNHSGSVTVQDQFDFLEAYFAGAAAGDTNDDGQISVQDIFDFLSERAADTLTPADRISGTSVYGIIDNPYGYCGYSYDSETAAAKVLGPNGGGLYHVRHRVYDPIAGRWLTRDPAGFVDGMNLYEYCSSGAVGMFDPLGLDDAACQGPVWHHLLPQDFRDKFKKIGLDIDSAEFGLLFEDHGTHMRGTFHTRWNEEWNCSVENSRVC